MLPFGGGIALRLGDAAAFRGGVLLELAPNEFPEHGAPLLVGVAGLIGGAFRLGDSALELRPDVTVGVLGARLHLGAGVALAVRFGT